MHLTVALKISVMPKQGTLRLYILTSPSNLETNEILNYLYLCLELSLVTSSGSFTLDFNTKITFTVSGDTLTTSTNFYGGLNGTLMHATRDIVVWSDGNNWTRVCADLSGK